MQNRQTSAERGNEAHRLMSEKMAAFQAQQAQKRQVLQEQRAKGARGKEAQKGGKRTAKARHKKTVYASAPENTFVVLTALVIILCPQPHAQHPPFDRASYVMMTRRATPPWRRTLTGLRTTVTAPSTTSSGTMALRTTKTDGQQRSSRRYRRGRGFAGDECPVREHGWQGGQVTLRECIFGP